MKMLFRPAVLVLPIVLGACAYVPTGPSDMALPGSRKSFDQFRRDDGQCRNYARGQLGGTSPGEAADASLARSAAVGTVLGAAIGAAADGGHGAGVGAATGLLMGTAAGTEEARYSGLEAQRRYDHAYLQCMYAKGHRIPVSGHFMTEQRPAYAPYPPPPPGYRYPLPPR